jgi:hypothetical protein
MIIVLLGSCVTTKPAKFYHISNSKGADVGKITQVVEKNGFSIISTELTNKPIYVVGKLKDVKRPYKSDARIWERSEDEYYFCYEGKRYEIVLNPEKNL